SAFGAVYVSMREAENIKRRKIVGATKRKVSEEKLFISKGNTDSYYFQYNGHNR
ncbi:hypothetical protein CLU79DRAFT_695921, partial [Phycomyces nitens]